MSVKVDGVAAQVLQPGEKAKLAAKAGARYRLVRQSEGKEVLADGLLATRQGDDLQLSFANGSELTLEAFFPTCKSQACGVELPSAQGAQLLLSADSASATLGSSGQTVFYAFGSQAQTTELLQARGIDALGLKGLSHTDGMLSYLPPSDSSWLGLVPLALLPLAAVSGTAAPVPTIIEGSVVAGPVVTGNGLKAVAYKADGSVLASATVKADGSFILQVGNDYTGPVLVKVSDANTDPDYFDEATGAPKDLGADLRALTVISTAGTYKLSVNVLTELAVRSLGLTGGDTGSSSVNFASVSTSQITQANQKVAAAVGLTQDLVLGTAPVAIITTDGSSNPQSNDYGRLLAAMSGAEVGSSTSAVLDDMAAKLQSSQTQSTGQVLEILLEGATKISVAANLVKDISDITNQKSTAITIAVVSQDNRLSPAEMIAGAEVQGTATAGASVSLAWSDASGQATATGTRSLIADSQGQWRTSFTSAELPAMGATTLKASVGEQAATRSIYLDEPLAPSIALAQTTGNRADLTRNGRVDVTGLLSGAGWDYSLDNGAHWTPGSGSSFTATGDGPQQVLVRQNIGGHLSPASNRLDFELDTTAPAWTSGPSAATMAENAGANQLIYTAAAIDARALTYSLQATDDASLLSINASTGAVTLTANPNFEAKPSYSFTMVATDAAGNASEQAVSLAIHNRDEVAPTLTSGATASAINENSGAGQTIYSATSTDTGDVATGSTSYSLKATGDASLLSINASTGAVSLTANPDFESKPSYSFTVVATDAAGNASEQVVSLAISNLDEVAPSLTSSATATAINENSGAAQTIYTAISTDTGDVATGNTNYSLQTTGDASLLSINTSTGAVTLTANPNFEAKPSYSFTVVATDAAGNASEQAVSLAITNLDEAAPTLTSGATATAIHENSGAGQTIYTTTSTDTGDIATGSTTYSLKATGDASLLIINASTGEVTLTANPNFEAKPSYSFTVVATDAAGNASEQAVSLAIRNRDEVAPSLTSGVTAAAVNENSGAGQTVYTATSTDTSDIATGSTSYSLQATGDASLLSIDPNTGAVTLTANPDFEAKPSYSFTVVVTDAAGNASEQALSLAINDLDEIAPTVSISASASSLGANATATLNFTLSEALANFSPFNVTVTGGELSNWAGSGTAYTATFTPDAGLSSAATVSVAANAVTDIAGNPNSAASNTVSITVDTLEPQVASISASRSSLRVDQTSNLSITLSEASTTFDLSDLQAVGGTLSNLAGSGSSYTATFTPDDNRTVPGSVSVTPRSFSDAAGNASQSSDNDGVVMAIQTLRPTATLSARQATLGMGEVSTIDITLSEKAADFDLTDLSASHGTLSEFTPLGDGMRYTVLFTPEAPYTGSGSVTLADGRFTNSAGNSNKGEGQAASTDNLAIDTTPPTVTITSDVTALAIGQSAKVTFTFNKDPGDSFDAKDITVNGGTLSNLVNHTGTIWTAQFTPTDGSTGEARISVASGSYKDAAGNKGMAGSTPAITIDTQGPVADSLLPGNATTVLPGQALVISFSEVVRQGAGNLVLVNDTANTRTTFAVTDPAVVLSSGGKTLTITPTTALVAGSQYHVEATPGSLLDTAGNAWAGLASSDWASSSWHFTAATPSVKLNRISTDNRVNATENTAGVVVSGTIESNTAGMVADFVAGDFAVTLTDRSTNVTIGTFTATSYNPQTGAWSLTLPPNTLVDGTSYGVNVAVNGSTGAALNATATTTGKVLADLSAAAPTLSLVNDTGSSNSDGKTSDATLNVAGLESNATWEYSTNGGSTWQAGSGTQFTAATISGTHTVQVRQTDAAGNVSTNVANAGTLTFTLDTSADRPVINAVATDNIINLSEVGSAITGTAEAGASVTLYLGSGKGQGSTTFISPVPFRKFMVTADSNGDWTYPLTTADLAALGIGQTQIVARQTDVAGNASFPTLRNITVDTLAPTVSIDTTQTQLNAANATSTLSFTLSEESTNFTASSVTAMGGTLSNFAGSGTQYTATFTPTNAATTAGSVKVSVGAFRDAAGNANAEASNTLELSVDTVVPTVAVNSSDSTLRAGEAATLTFTLSEASDSFGADSLKVVGGTLGPLSANVGRTVYTGVFKPTPGFAGAGSVTVADSAFFDRGGNPNADGAEANNSVALAIQGAIVTLDISSDTTVLKAGETATISFSFSAAPTGFAAGDITVAGGTLGPLTTVDSTHYTAIFTPTAGVATGTATVSVAAGSYTGASGNLGQGASVGELSFDTLAPTLKTLNPEDGSYLAANSGASLVATFTENVVAGTGNLRLVDNTTNTTHTYAVGDSAVVISGDTLTLTPTTALVAGRNYHIAIDNTALLDAAGNAYAGISNATSWNFTASNLSTTLNPAGGDGWVNTAEKAVAMASNGLQFSGTVSSVNAAVLDALQASDIVVSVTLPDRIDNDGGGQKVVTFTASSYDSTTGAWTADMPKTWEYTQYTLGLFNIRIGSSTQTRDTLSNGHTDSIAVTVTGRNGTAAAGLSVSLNDSLSVDLSAPATPTLILASDTGSSNSDGITRNGLINVGALEAGGTWQYSEDNGANWQAGTGTSLALTQDGTYALQVKQADVAGNASATRSLAVTLDTQAAAPSVNAVANDNRINASETSSAISGTADANASVSLVIGANTRTVTANSSGVWTYTLVAGDITAMGQGNQVIQVSQSDKAGNTSAATKAVLEIDTVRPTVTLANIGSANVLAGQSTTFTATLSELSPSFSADSLTVSGGTVKKFKADATGLVYTGTFTPDADSTTAGSIGVAAGAVSDAFDNTNSTASNTLALAVNTVRPTVAVTSSVAANSILRAGDTATVTFTLSASSSDFTAADVAVTGGALSNFAGAGTHYTATFTPDANSSAPGSVSVANGSFANAATNTNADGADANNSVVFAIATGRPTVSISSDRGTLSGGQTALISFKFSEDPGNSFSWDGNSGDIAVTGGTLSAIQGSGSNFTAMFTPAAGFAGAASITLANGSYTNSSASLGQAGTSPAITIDTVTPTVAISRSASGTLGEGQTDTLTFDFSEAPGNSIHLADVDVSGGILGVLSAVTATRYVAVFQPTASASGTAKISIASQRFSDAAGNSNADGSDTDNTLTIPYNTGGSPSSVTPGADTPVLSLAVDNGTSSVDRITSNGLVKVSALAAGARWEYSTDSGSSWTQGTGESFVLATGVYRTGTVLARQFDSNNQVSAVGDLTPGGSAPADIRLANSSNLTLSLSRDTGVSATDGITYDASIKVEGMAATDTWSYSLNNGLTWTVGSTSFWTHQGQTYSANVFGFPMTPGFVGQKTGMVKVLDAAGNSTTATYSFTLDTALPARPNVTLTPDPNDGGAIVAPTNIEEGAVVTYRVQLPGSSNFDNWSSTYTAPSATALGKYTLQVRQTDIAGQGSVNTIEFEIKLPATPLHLSAISAGVGGFVIRGQSADDQSGYSVSSAGDVNGDGLDDLLIGARAGDPTATAVDAGRSYVVFGKSTNVAIDLSALAGGSSTLGFVINGLCKSDASGTSVASAGDVNADGLADLIIGAPFADRPSGTDAGQTYVVFGKPTGAAIDLSSIANGSSTLGFVINGASGQKDSLSGFSVSAAGDVNGDGLSDMVVGAIQSLVSGQKVGRSYVVFGKSTGSAIDLGAIAAIGAGANSLGFAINGEKTDDSSGYSVSAAGDVNGDGLSDLIVGAPYSDTGTSTDVGRSYVVFGKCTGESIDLSAITAGTSTLGFVIIGQSKGDKSGFSVSGAGDVNGDGLADLVVGAPDAANLAGRSYVVFGKAKGTPVNLSGLAAGVGGGFVINGLEGGKSGYSVSSAGDLNGDGLFDLILGAPNASPAGVLGGGNSYVVFGKSTSSLIDLSAVVEGNGGFVISGECKNGASGQSVSSAGDVNGDGLTDLIVGAPGSAQSYVIFGSTRGAFASGTLVDLLGTDGADTLSDAGRVKTLVGGAGNDIFTTTAASVLYGGSGNDSFNVDKFMTQALEWRMNWGGNITRLARIDGGSGFDTLALAAGTQLNLSKVADSAAGDAEGSDRLVSIERVDLSAANTALTLSAIDIAHMVGMNSFNSTNGWTGLGAIVPRHQLQVVGTQGTLNVSGLWRYAGTATDAAGASFNVYNGDGSTQLLLGGGRTIARTAVELGDVAMGLGGFAINGQSAGDMSGFSVARAGDVNGDGLGDLIIGAHKSDMSSTVTDAGRSYVVFGTTSNSPIDLSAVATGVGGFAITGQSGNDQSGYSVGSAGDLNGDGLADLMVGAPYSDMGSSVDVGRSYVVYGKSTGTAVSLSDVAKGSGGFVINGQGASDQSGWSVSSAGDVNGDGLLDLLVGAPLSDLTATAKDGGRSYVLFGKTSMTAFNLADLTGASGGFVINGQAASDNSGFSVSAAGDVNGDGLADILVGAYKSDPSALAEAGRSYVIFGKSNSTAVMLSALGSGGFFINGHIAGDQSGYSVSSAGDVNGDGLADVLVAATQSDPGTGTTDAGRSYVVFGKTTSAGIDLSALTASGAGGFVINGQSAGDQSGWSVSSAGDMNGDGLSDIIVGVPYGDPVTGTDAGRSYVVFGRTISTPIELSAVAAGSGGFAINGQAMGEQSGWSVTSAGDVNGDGLADLLVGAPGADPSAGTDAGRSYVIFGSTSGVLGKGTFVDQMGSSAADSLGFDAAPRTFVGGAGNDTFTANGPSVLYGGSGNDRFIVNWNLGEALQVGLSGTKLDRLARIDGGGGLDTLVLGTRTALSLSRVADSAGADIEGSDRITSIERIDLSADGSAISLSSSDVARMAGMNSFNSSNGWTGLAATVPLHQLQVVGTAGEITVAGNWRYAGTATDGAGARFNLYNGESNTQLLLGDGRTLPSLPVQLSAVAQGPGGFVIHGQAAGDGSGYSIAGAGDVNGDGLSDLIIGAPFSDPTTASAEAGRSYVVFGTTAGGAIALSNLGGGSGFVINGQSKQDLSGFSVAGAGDVNGDGLMDLLIGAPYSDKPIANAAYGRDAGRSYVVFGKRDGTGVNLSTVVAGSGGFVIDGYFFDGKAGSTVSSVGDFNGDGLSDLVVASGDGNYGTFLLFGKKTGTAIDLVEAGNTLNRGIFFAADEPPPDPGYLMLTNGFVINDRILRPRSGGWNDAIFRTGTTASSAGDVNGDGLADLIIGDSTYDPSAGTDAGRSYVVFGRKGYGSIDMTAVAAGSGGFAIDGRSPNDLSGYSVSSAGDVNGDGLADLLVGAPRFASNSAADDGYSYVVFGKTTGNTVKLADVAGGVGGFAIKGRPALDLSGYDLSSAGDINGDGLADLIVSTSGEMMERNYVVFGKTSTTPVNLSAVDLGYGGFAIQWQRPDPYRYVRSSVSSAGDVNGDGLADLLVSAIFFDGDLKPDAGRTYVIFGNTSNTFMPNTLSQTGGSGNDSLNDNGTAQLLVGGGGNDTLTATAASVLRGGAGSDTFVINQTMVTALQTAYGQTGNSGSMNASIEGGQGGINTVNTLPSGASYSVDKLVLSGANITLDLTQVSNVGHLDPELNSRLSGIEVVNLGAASNKLKLTAKDVLDLSDAVDLAMVSINYSDFRQLVVQGPANSTLDLADGTGTTGWSQMKNSGNNSFATVTGANWGEASQSYSAWVNDNHAIVLVQSGVLVV